MTASMHKKEKKAKKRKNKLLLFSCVFAGVLVVGTVLLMLLAVYKGKAGSYAGGPETAGGGAEAMEASEQNGAETGREALGQDGTEQAASGTGSGAGSLLDNMKSEVVREPETSGRYDALLQDAEAMKAQNIYAKQAASVEETVLCFAGDILFDPQYAIMSRLQQRGGSIEEAFSGELLTVMRDADIFMVNNEFPYTDRGTPLPEKQFTFRAAPESVSYLEEMGVDIVSLANNHASDYGEVSLLDSLHTLKEAGIPYVGAGRNLEEAARPVNFIINDKKIAVLSATQIERNDNPDTKGAGDNSPGTFRCWNVEKLLEAVTEAKKNSDVVIVYIHWGTENQAETDWAQQAQAPLLAEAGADLIIGDHPHCLQPVGYAGGVPVVYSLGNFLFNSKTLDTCIVKVRIAAGGGLSLQVLPAKQSDCRTQLLEGAEKQRVIDYLNAISGGTVLDADGNLLPEKKA